MRERVGFKRGSAVSVVQTEIDRFLGSSAVPLYVGGSWTPARGGAAFEVRQPADGSVLAVVASGDGADRVGGSVRQ